MILTVVLIVILCDILSKYLVVQLLAPHGQAVTLIPGVLDFDYVTNKGAAFGMLSDHRWIFMSASVVFIACLVYVLKKSSNEHILYKVSLVMILGGGIGNMIDRIFLGYVVDFIEFTFVDFATFNIADSAITVGMVCLVVYFVFFDKTFFKRSGKGGEDVGNSES